VPTFYRVAVQILQPISKENDFYPVGVKQFIGGAKPKAKS
jgi:hypothetical protein